MVASTAVVLRIRGMIGPFTSEAVEEGVLAVVAKMTGVLDTATVSDVVYDSCSDAPPK
jgi:hypothetical protein